MEGREEEVSAGRIGESREKRGGEKTKMNTREGGEGREEYNPCPGSLLGGRRERLK